MSKVIYGLVMVVGIAMWVWLIAEYGSMPAGDAPVWVRLLLGGVIWRR